jgi:hypothetical protein
VLCGEGLGDSSGTYEVGCLGAWATRIWFSAWLVKAVCEIVLALVEVKASAALLESTSATAIAKRSSTDLRVILFSPRMGRSTKGQRSHPYNVAGVAYILCGQEHITHMAYLFGCQDVTRDIARDLSAVVKELAALKADANHWLTAPE